MRDAAIVDGSSSAPWTPEVPMKLIPRALILCLVLAAAAWPARAGGGIISADDANRRARTGEITVIDVRSPAEWRRTGIAKGGKTVTIHDPDGPAGFFRAMLAAVGGDKTKPVALICARGNRSTRAYEFLRSRGFVNVYNIAEGMLGNGQSPGWIARGLPVAPCREC